MSRPTIMRIGIGFCLIAILGGAIASWNIIFKPKMAAITPSPNPSPTPTATSSPSPVPTSPPISSGRITITVQDPMEGLRVSSAEINLYEADGRIVSSSTTDHTGIATFDDIPFATYTAELFSVDGESLLPPDRKNFILESGSVAIQFDYIKLGDVPSFEEEPADDQISNTEVEALPESEPLDMEPLLDRTGPEPRTGDLWSERWEILRTSGCLIAIVFFTAVSQLYKMKIERSGN